MHAFDPDRLDARDAKLVARLLPIARAFTRTYLRLAVDGEHTLPRGPTMFVSNHNGGIMGPDLACTLATLWERLGPEAPLYAMAHDFAMRQVTPLGRLLQRVGALRASRANAERVLEAGASFLVYPGGDLEAYRHFRRRDEIVLGDRDGFVRVAQKAGAAIVPIVAHGAHRSAYIFHEGRALARVLRMKRWARVERFPLALALPWGLAPGPWVPYAPLPFRIRLRFLSAENCGSHEDPSHVKDRIRTRMQAALDDMAHAARA